MIRNNSGLSNLEILKFYVAETGHSQFPFPLSCSGKHIRLNNWAYISGNNQGWHYEVRAEEVACGGGRKPLEDVRYR